MIARVTQPIALYFKDNDLQIVKYGVKKRLISKSFLSVAKKIDGKSRDI